MDFYVSKIKKIKSQQGVDIGKSDSHGGLSNGAIGFDSTQERKKNIKNRDMNKINIIDCTLRDGGYYNIGLSKIC